MKKIYIIALCLVGFSVSSWAGSGVVKENVPGQTQQSTMGATAESAQTDDSAQSDGK